ncbi:aspartyl protease family protein [Amycolatopsis sp.]|uniref:aspartyl protease family protein n=1 Tax=Amycolatopsis sp. TaxID=37632 RepID=UPI002D7EAFB3|nr:aspartyl protease family protein [Amycolatopsis sp.]HET6711340.1 aspartyl protease family protein [Amycolatopsis sp.]
MTDFPRRTFLAGTGLAAASLLHSAPVAAAAEATGPDRLFSDGWFAAADRGYARILGEHPDDAHAVAQRGYIALLGNRFADAEKFLSRAISLGDPASRQRLAECFVRQDRHDRAVPLLRSTGDPRDQAYAELYSHLEGPAWQVHGAADTRLPFLMTDPVPAVEASVNGGSPKGFLLDTYAPLDLNLADAEEAGLRSLATVPGRAMGGPITIHLGILESLRVGGIELRNIPMQWADIRRPALPDGTQPTGVLGTTVFYHLLATMDYAGRALRLRQRAAGCRTAGHRLPLWLAGDHFPCSLGSVLGYGPRVVTLDTGGLAHGLDTTVELAERLGIPVDRAHPRQMGGTTVYPITAERISLGGATGHDVRGFASERGGLGIPGPGQAGQFGFTPIANFTHEFFKPFAITFDYTAMRLFIR